MELVYIPAGKFTMGSSKEEIDRCLKLAGGDGALKEILRAEGPEHEVQISMSFYLGTTEVTVGHFRQFILGNPKNDVGDAWLKPGFEQSDDHPVVNVSWNDAVAFCAWLSDKEGKQYRLPTEAEWEYCCRAGKPGNRYCFGNEEIDLGSFAWYDANSGNRTHPVGKLKPNAWGLYDMHGNTWEWCQDRYDPNYYKASPKKDPTGGNGSMRVTRGGSWNNGPIESRSAFRAGHPPIYRLNHVGFRVLLVP